MSTGERFRILYKIKTNLSEKVSTVGLDHLVHAGQEGGEVLSLEHLLVRQLPGGVGLAVPFVDL